MTKTPNPFEDPTVPADYTPPREVNPLTHVTGHNVTKSNVHPAPCECGERRPADWEGTFDEWRDQHLREAWPILVPRDGLSHEDWMAKISDAFVEASRVEQELYDRLGLGRSVRPGEEMPTITDEYTLAGERVTVLKHQLDQIRAKVLARQFGTSEA